MYLTFDEVRDKLDDVFWYQWDPKNINHIEESRNAYYDDTERLAEIVIDQGSRSRIEHYLNELLKKYSVEADALQFREAANACENLANILTYDPY